MAEGAVLITGGAGFIGSNLAAHYLARGCTVRVFDNLSRRGTERNLAWLQSMESGSLEFVRGDVRDFDQLRCAGADVSSIFHLASQVAVTTSVLDPRLDFEVNALGTLNALEVARESRRRPAVLFASTNKVYGSMAETLLERGEGGYRYRYLPHGIGEEHCLDFHSPYGCSKGAADQYVRDYSRIYRLPTVVFRQSCVYGPRQLGNEDQGWVAHFVISALLGRPITIYGDGHQVRDLLHVHDLVRAFDLALQGLSVARGRVYNIGGGFTNSISLRGLIGLLERELGESIVLRWAGWRPGDQKVYVSDIRRAASDLAWTPRIGVEEGVRRLLGWIKENRDLFDAGEEVR